MQIDGHSRLAAVLANPIKHSLSPFIHNMAFDKTGINGVYLAWEIDEVDLLPSLENIKRYDMWGVNISMPYKTRVLPYLDRLDSEAEWIGAVNTIVLDEGQLVGYNTDGRGFWRSLAVEQGFDVSGKTICLIGSGSTAKAIISQACLMGVGKIFVLSKAAYLANLREQVTNLSQKTGVTIRVLPLTDRTFLQECLQVSQILINASSVGMDGQSLPLPDGIILPSHLLVADVIYQPFETPFLIKARENGLRTVNGLGMLLYQAAESFRLWTGQEMPTDEIWQALRERIH